MVNQSTRIDTNYKSEVGFEAKPITAISACCPIPISRRVTHDSAIHVAFSCSRHCHHSFVIALLCIKLLCSASACEDVPLETFNDVFKRAKKADQNSPVWSVKATND